MSGVNEDDVSAVNDGSAWERQEEDADEMNDDSSIEARDDSMVEIKYEVASPPNSEDSREIDISDEESEAGGDDEEDDDGDGGGDSDDQQNNKALNENSKDKQYEAEVVSTHPVEDTAETQLSTPVNPPTSSEEQLQQHKSNKNQNTCKGTDNEDAMNMNSEYSSYHRKYKLKSVEHIPESHQTLKMRLKLRAPVIVKPENPQEEEGEEDEEEEEDNEEEAAVEQPVKRKRRGRPPIQVKKEPKKVLQISLGNQAERWQEVKNLAKNLKFHSQVAKLLLDCFGALLDGSLQWTSNSTDCDLKVKLSKMLADKKMAPPNNSWLLTSKRRRKAAPVRLSPPKKLIFKEDSQDDDFDDNINEFLDNSTDEDYSPVKTIQKAAKRVQPKRRKQATPRRVVKATSSVVQVENKRVKPLKVIVSKNHIKKEGLSDGKKKASGKKRGGKKSDENQPKSVISRTVAIPPEFATYPKIYKCRRCPPKCEDTYATLDLLQEHFITHKQDNDVPKKRIVSNISSELVSSCKFGEATEEEAVQRMAKVLIRCPDCKKMFFPGRLVQHLRTAHVRVLCDECGGMFSRVAMWEHKKAHKFKAQGKKPYKCDKCDKEFLWQVSLRQHRELHSKERPFICSACGKSFKTLTKMKRHEIIHEAVKPFTCPHCQRSFTQRTNLKTHIRTHTGEKPYRCDYCSKTFTHKVSMKTHMKKEHGVDLWRDGPSHRVQEFDDVRCQMKRRKNPETTSIQNILTPEIKSTSYQETTQNVHAAQYAESVHLGAPPQSSDYPVESVEKPNSQETNSVEEQLRKEPPNLHPFLDEQRELMKGRVDEERYVVQHVDSRSHGISESAQEMVQIASGVAQHVEASEDTLDRQNVERQVQNCISPGENVDQISLRDKAQLQQAHDLNRTGVPPQSHNSMHYTPHFLPVSTDINLTHQTPSSNPSHSHSRYLSSNNQDGTNTRYSTHMSSGAPRNIRQGSFHHDLQQEGMHHSHPAYPLWASSQGGGSQVFVQGELRPGIINDLMKMGK